MLARPSAPVSVAVPAPPTAPAQAPPTAPPQVPTAPAAKTASLPAAAQGIPNLQGQTLENASSILETLGYGDLAVIVEGSMARLSVTEAKIKLSKAIVDTTEPAPGANPPKWARITIFLGGQAAAPKASAT